MIVRPNIIILSSIDLKNALHQVSGQVFKVLMYLIEYEQNYPKYHRSSTYTDHEQTKARKIAEGCNMSVDDVIGACIELRKQCLLDGLTVTQAWETVWINWVLHTELPPEGLCYGITSLERNNVDGGRSVSDVLVVGTERYANKSRMELLANMPYEKYLQTPEWKEKAKEAYKRAGHRCQLCNRNKIEIHAHHRSYERRGEELPEDLIVLCADCHELFHKNRSLAKE